MKKRICMILACALVVVIGMFSVVACGNPNEANNEENNANKENNVIELFEGTWYCYKATYPDDSIDYRNFFIKIELSIKFSADKTYVCDYYANGKHGDKYPQSGTYTVLEDTLVLAGDVTGVAKIDGTDLILSYDNSVVQYYQRNKI